MPTKFLLCKWLCDECPWMCDTEPECWMHEREMHKPAVDDLHLLDQICTRLERAHNSVEQLQRYERVCYAMLKTVIENKTRSANENTTASSESEVLCEDGDREKSMSLKPQMHSPTTGAIFDRGDRHALFDVDQPDVDAASKYNDQSTKSVNRRNRSDENFHNPCANRTGDERHKCDACDKEFVQVTSLHKHRQHAHKIRSKFACSARRPYECGDCAMAFTYKHVLKLHIQRKHTMDKPFACEQCGRSFISAYERKTHMFRSHGSSV